MPNNLDRLIALKERYQVGNMEVADLIEYSYDGVNHWFRKESTQNTLRPMVLKAIENALKAKYPDK